MTRRKIWDVEHPPVVLLVGAGDRIERLGETVRGATELRVEHVADAEAAIDRIDRRPAVECCWIGAGLSTDACLDLIESVAETDPATVVVYAPDEDDVAIAARATELGASEYVAADASIDGRRGRLEAAVDRAIDRRHDARKRSMLDSFVEELDANVFAKDDRARHLVASTLTTRSTGNDPFGLTDPEAFDADEDTLRETYRDDLAVIEEGRRIQGKIEHFPDYAWTWQWTAKVPWTEDGETLGLVGLTMDFSEWKERERDLLQELGYLQRMPKYLTHDLRNPLSIARGYVQLARDGEPGALDTVEDSLDRMNEKLTEFHGLVSEGAASELALVPVQFETVVSEVWDHVSLPGAELTLAIDPDVRILADEGQLRSLLENVFRNAIDHAGPRVTVRIELTETGFAISDDGPGLDASIDDAVFETGTTTNTNAAGLGLAIVSEIAHLHGWSVDTGDGGLGGAAFVFTDCCIGRPSNRTPSEASVDLSASVDVGSVTVDGSSDTRDDVVTVRGAGANVWGTVNEFHYVHATLADDVRLEARVAGMGVASERSKAGAMVRSGLDPDAAYAGICRMADRVPELLWREREGDRGRSQQVDGAADGCDWIAVERVDDDIHCAISSDGDEWLPVDRRSIALADDVHIGLFVCAVADELIEARFEDVDVRRLE